MRNNFIICPLIRFRELLDTENGTSYLANQTRIIQLILKPKLKQFFSVYFSTAHCLVQNTENFVALQRKNVYQGMWPPLPLIR